MGSASKPGFAASSKVARVLTTTGPMDMPALSEAASGRTVTLAGALLRSCAATSGTGSKEYTRKEYFAAK